MKHTFSLALITCLLFLISSVISKKHHQIPNDVRMQDKLINILYLFSYPRLKMLLAKFTLKIQ